MSEYQVIARKWRPRRFADVVGQQHIVRTLRNAVISGRTAHAYILVGPRGIGKTTLARIFARALMCLSPKDGEPCGECKSCKAIAEDRCLDLVEIDAASHNSVSTMRDLVEEIATLPAEGKYKIYIIDEVHMLSNSAWNALLKTIEEPPEHVKFIFATTEVDQVLPTILSRCQRFDLQPISTADIIGRLQLICDTEKVKIAPEAVEAVARAAEGGMRDAQSLLDQIIAFFSGTDGETVSVEQVCALFGLTSRADLVALVAAMIANSAKDVVTMINAQCAKGRNIENLFDDLMAMLRAVHLCKILDDPSELIKEGPESIADYRKLASVTDADKLQILLETLSGAGFQLKNALNKQIFLETLILRAMREAHSLKVGDLVAKLNQLRAAGDLQCVDAAQPAAPQVIVLQHSAAPAAPVAASVAPQVTAPAAAPAEPPPAPQAPEPVTETEASPEPAAQQPAESNAGSTGEFRRKSVISSHPELIENSLNDKFVADVAKTFEARPIDVHVPVE